VLFKIIVYSFRHNIYKKKISNSCFVFYNKEVHERIEGVKVNRGERRKKSITHERDANMQERERKESCYWSEERENIIH
jgi:hypothetical protein